MGGTLDGKRVLAAYAGTPRVTVETVDNLTDDGSIEALAGRVGAVDHVVATASARARGLGEEKRQAKFRHLEETLPVPRVGTAEDVGEASLGERLV